MALSYRHPEQCGSFLRLSIVCVSHGGRLSRISPTTKDGVLISVSSSHHFGYDEPGMLHYADPM